MHLILLVTNKAHQICKLELHKWSRNPPAKLPASHSKTFVTTRHDGKGGPQSPEPPNSTHWGCGSLWVSPVISDRLSLAFIQHLITASKTSVSSSSRGEWEDRRAFKKWLVSRNCWPGATLSLIIGFFTLSVLGNHQRVMMHYAAWKTSLSSLWKSDSITYHFRLVNKTVLLRGVVSENTECFLLLPKNYSSVLQ